MTTLAPYNRARRSRCIAYGLCTTCGDKAATGLTKCQFHRDEDAARLRLKRQQAKTRS